MEYRIFQEKHYTVVMLKGNVQKTEESKALEEEILRLIEKGQHHFLFDLVNVDYLDSSGISIFIQCLFQTQQHRGKVFFVIEDSTVRDVIELVGLDKLIKIYGSFEEFKKEQLP